jgi:hypothetical protein
MINTTDSSLKYPEGSESEVKAFFRMEKQFVFSVLDKLGITPTPEERDAIAKVPTESYLAFMAYCRGLDHRSRGEFDQAKVEFNSAAGQDPGFGDAAKQAGLMAAAAAPPGGGGDFPPFEAAVLGTAGPGETPGAPSSGLDVRLAGVIFRTGIVPGLSGSPNATFSAQVAGTGTVVIRGTTDGQ